MAAAALIIMTMLAPTARAQQTNEVSIYGGRTSVDAKVLANAEALGVPAKFDGSAYGVSWLRAVSPFVHLGLDVSFLKPGPKRIDVGSGYADAEVDSTSVLGLARFGPSEGDVRPSFLLGLGVHQTSIRLDLTPNPGFFWKDTSTSETRTYVNSGGHAIAAKIQGGADYAFRPNVLAGVFAGFHIIGSTTYETTEAAKRFGHQDVTGGMTAVSFGARLSATF